MGDMDKAVDVRVTGLVQGVSFRAYARQQAGRLGVAGWVRNEPDGSVSAHLEGPDDAVDALVEWYGHGPAYAEVQHVEVSPAEPTGTTGFAIG
jgi:acylphosphatase